jgi:tyrosyl-tRNA synthetase
VLENAKSIKEQLQRLIKKVEVVNNYDWTKDIDVLSFLRDYGKHFSVSNMIAKDTIAKRLETGISYTEFSYMVLQSLDFLLLAKNYNCYIQFGGSDQWGNITSGVDLIRRKLEKEAVGGTIHLLLNSQGQKFGKSEGNAVFLNSSPYKIYQHFLNTSDPDVEPFLKLFTFLPLSQISEIVKNSQDAPGKRIGQKVLANEVVSQLFSPEVATKMENIAATLFSDKVHELDSKEIELVLEDVSSLDVSGSISIIDALVGLKAVSSKSEGRKLIEAHGVSIDGKEVDRLDYIVEGTKKIRVVKKGKKNYYLLRF